MNNHEESRPGVDFFLALLMFILAGRYLTLNPEVYFPEQKAVYIAHTAGLLIHIIGAILTVIIGPFQFLPRIITKKYIRLHRWMGKIYLSGVVFGSLGGFYMALMAVGRCYRFHLLP